MRSLASFPRLCIWLSLLCIVSFALNTLAVQSADAQQRRQQQESEGDDDSGGESPTPRARTTEVVNVEVADEKFVSVAYNITLKTDGPDFKALEALKEGQVHQITMSAVPKLKTDLNLAFGDTIVKTENVSKSYPGVYGLWLKKTAAGWSLVLNSRADVWGTMYDAAADVVEVPLAHENAPTPTEALKMVIEGEGAARTLRITWGPHAWTAGFTVQG